MTPPAPTPRSLPLRGRVFRAVSLAPEAPLADWLGLLDGALKRSPTLFSGKTVVLDVSALAPDRTALDVLLADLAIRGVRLAGIEGASRDLAEMPAVEMAAGRRAGWPPLLPAGHARGEPVQVPAVEEKRVASLTIEGSVRSGQSIVHPDGDVTVMGSVSSGAEILAGGSVHVYGALRGRVIAGAAKNPRARIYCRKFEPELLGIDRLVRSAEDIGTHLRGQAVQIWLDGSAIKIAALG